MSETNLGDLDPVGFPRFKASERNLFGPYPTGDGREVYGDPLQLHMDLTHFLGGDPAAVLRVYNGRGEAGPATEEEVYEATRKIVAASRAAFGLADFNGDPAAPPEARGADSRLALDLFKHYLDWRRALKKNGERTASSPAPTPGAEIYQAP